jgi:hypothetical protein
VDQIHPRAFTDGWFHNPLAKGSESSEAISDRHYEDLPLHWSETIEMRQRLWERTPPSMLLSLCRKEECNLEDFVQGIRTDVGKPVAVTRSKRKLVKPSDNQDKESTLEGQKVEGVPLMPTPQDFGPVSGDIIADSVVKPSTVPGESESSSVHVQQGVDSKVGIESIDDSNKSALQGRTDEDGQEKQISNDLDKIVSPDSSDTPKKGNKRRSRRSGRFGRHNVEAEPLGKKGSLSLSEANSTPRVLSDLELQIMKHKESKIPEIEKIAKGQLAKEMLWPLAGRKPFVPFGHLGPREMKRLARNAGSVMAPHVAYSTSHEVGQVCLGHTWRRRTELCSSIEELILLIRILESCLDRAVRSCCHRLKDYFTLISPLSPFETGDSLV